MAFGKNSKKVDSDLEKRLDYLINSHNYSDEKKRMLDGERYFACEHDVVFKNFNESTISEFDPKLQKDVVRSFVNPNRSNHRQVNPYHHTLVMQKASYLVGKEPTIYLQNDNEANSGNSFLTDFCDDKFNQVLFDLIIGASNKGVEYLHIYYDDFGKFSYEVVPAEEIIPIYDEKNHKKIKEIIRYYDTFVWEVDKEVKYEKVELWTDADVTFFTRDKSGKLILDKKIPHWEEIKYIDGEEVERVSCGFGKVPFIPLYNNGKKTSDLQLIKDLVDAYDLISSEGTNNLLDLVDLYWVIQGYGGETASAITKKLHTNKAVHINDSTGNIEAKQIDLPMEGRLEWLDILRRDIFNFGMGIDLNSDNFTQAPSGVALKFQYSLFTLKIQTITANLKSAISELLNFALDDFRRKNELDIPYSKIQIILNLNNIVDDAEIMDIIKNSEGIVSHKTLLGRHPFINDANEEIVRINEENMKNMEEDYEEKS